MRRLTAAAIWTTGVALVVCGIVLGVSNVPGDMIFIVFAAITGYNLFLGNQRGHAAHVVLACCLVTASGLWVFSSHLTASQIGAVAAIVVVAAGACALGFRRKFYDDYRSGTSRNYF